MPPEPTTSQMVRLRARVRGLVQGVNFRWFTQRRARGLGLRGYVRNMPDGTVRVIAEGPRAELDELLDVLRVGPTAAIVESVETEWEAPTGEFDGFEVRY